MDQDNYVLNINPFYRQVSEVPKPRELHSSFSVVLKWKQHSTIAA